MAWKSALVSCFFVVFSHLALAMIPCFFSFFSLLSMLCLSALLLVACSVLGRCSRRLLRIYASAPAFVVFNILFVWGVYIIVIREGIPSANDAVVTTECTLLMIGLYCILFSDPGLVICDHSSFDRVNPSSFSNHDYEYANFLERVRYCDSCKAFIRGFDHHCPAFGNCIGRKNHILFMVVLVGFIISEASYIVCSFQYTLKFQNINKFGLESNPPANFAISTMLFCVLQVLWQVLFLIWHIYCICFNIKTDEWINWKKYPEFQIVDRPEPGQLYPEVRFKNPYDNGVLGNIKDFLQLKD